MEINRLFSGELPKVGLNIVIWTTFSGILFIPKAWWTRTKLAVAAGLLLFEAAAGVVLFQEIKLLYVAAIFILAAAIHFSLPKSPLPAMAAMFVTALLYMRFGREDLFNLLSFIVLAVVLYFNIRSRLQRDEMFELNKRHLAELQEAYDQLQDASDNAMKYAVLEERTRIAREIHDAVGHSLTSIIVQMQAMRYMIRNDSVRAERSLEGALAAARQGLQDIRTSVHSLADDRSISGVMPIKALLSRTEETSSVRFSFLNHLQDEDMNVNVFEVWYRVLQEAITNILRHSQATQVEVSLYREAGNAVMRIRDNGMIIASQELRQGFGLKVMKARLEEKGGALRYSIQEPHGLELIAEIPAFDQGKEG
jgi:signal transduction histidine kinase